ncbi:hypothetical protein Hanom_Chr01g00092391 [Helianthus anomalus]
MSSNTFSTFKDADLRLLSHVSTVFSLLCLSSASSRTAWMLVKSSLRVKISFLNPQSRLNSLITSDVSLPTTSFTRTETAASAMLVYAAQRLIVIQELMFGFGNKSKKVEKSIHQSPTTCTVCLTR